VYSSSSLYAGVASASTANLPLGLDGIFIVPGANYIVASKISDPSNPQVAWVNIPDSNPNAPFAVKIVNQTTTIPTGFDGGVLCQAFLQYSYPTTTNRCRL